MSIRVQPILTKATPSSDRIWQARSSWSCISSRQWLHPDGIPIWKPPFVLKSPIQSHLWCNTLDTFSDLMSNNNWDSRLKSHRTVSPTLKTCNASALRTGGYERKSTSLHGIPTDSHPWSWRLQSISTWRSCSYKRSLSCLKKRYICHFLQKEGGENKNKKKIETKIDRNFSPITKITPVNFVTHIIMNFLSSSLWFFLHWVST